MGLYGKKEPVARSPEEYLDRLPEGRRDDVGRLHARVRELAPDMEPSADKGLLTYSVGAASASSATTTWTVP